jgi:glutamate carboxypeptidase
MKLHLFFGCLRLALAVCLAATATQVFAQPAEPVFSLAKKEKPALLETLKAMVSIETGSRDFEGLGKLASLIAGRLKMLGGKVDLVEPRDIYKMEDTPEKIGRMVRATIAGKGTKKILLIAHMDTVYPRGMLAKQPFRVDGDRAYGLGIADDKQGIAVILHTLTILKEMNFQQYGTLTVLINADEEISSPGSRGLIAKLGAEHDATFSVESSLATTDKLSLATSGIAAVTLTVKGRASHSGNEPEKGVNALYELAYQVLQTRDFSDPAVGVKMNWTLANAGTTRNMIPPNAQAVADVRVLRVADYEAIENKVREAIKKQLLPDAKVEMNFERRRPPLEATPSSRALGKHAQQIYSELGRKLVVDDAAEGGGTDAAFTALNTKAPVIERFGLQGYGAHSAEAEYVMLDSIEPRLYLLARMIMEVSKGNIPPLQ